MTLSQDSETAKDSRRKKISISIDGETFTTRDDDQESASLLRLAGRDPDQYNLARLVPGGEPKEFGDGKVIDLKDGDAFVSVKQRVTLHFTIDGVQHSTRDDDQEAASLLRLAGLDPAAYDIARVKDGHEPKVFKDRAIVKIHEGDVFVSLKQSSPVA
ncbi:hypothetical protein [Protaetiibacter intestinalis]|uniref:Multi-ubiquitin domain-containing protein n=1 Tax=Protaetiibacter intestinalis TaxID=2419774 RepID=A0A387B7L8_9MICO|nr:hypothetical protein [Protaetiibacter intestinalis]AYF97185.1 hypothetical protein D7I47_02265 [Protaetiibacter intestinalis]